MLRKLSFDENKAGQPSHLEALLNAGESQVNQEQFDGISEHQKKEEQEKVSEKSSVEDEKEFEMPTHIRISFSERKLLNKVLYLIYKIFRVFFTAIWFYFAPILALTASYTIPYAFNTNRT